MKTTPRRLKKTASKSAAKTATKRLKKSSRFFSTEDEPTGVLAGPRTKSAAAKLLAKLKAQVEDNIAAAKKEAVTRGKR